jgi:hypothetical protein
MKKPKKTHGGKRKGAGRKPLCDPKFSYNKRIALSVIQKNGASVNNHGKIVNKEILDNIIDNALEPKNQQQ